MPAIAERQLETGWGALRLVAMAKMKSLIVLPMLAVLLVLGYPTSNQSQTRLADKPQPETAIPDQFRSLYQELAETIHQDRQTFPFRQGARCPIVAADLLWASSIFGPAGSDSKRWKDQVATLDAFKAMRMTGVHIMISAPDLTTGDPSPLIDFYQRLAREIHSRGMKLYVEHFVSPPFSPHAIKGLRDDPQGREEFLAMMAKEVSLIYREIKPDYLSLITEPETTMRLLHLSFSAEELANWIGKVTTTLKSQGASPNTLLGAGAGTWESADFVLGFARQAQLDYIDFHLFGLKMNGENQVAKLVTLIRKIRETRPKMEIALGEMWLWKHGAMEPKESYRESLFRDNFSFWSSLDQQFLQLMMAVAQKENISVAVPYFSQYFFTYYTFGDAESSSLPPWPGSVSASWDRALEAIRKKEFSATGKSISAMLANDGN